MDDDFDLTLNETDAYPTAEFDSNEACTKLKEIGKLLQHDPAAQLCDAKIFTSLAKTTRQLSHPNSGLVLKKLLDVLEHTLVNLRASTAAFICTMQEATDTDGVCLAKTHKLAWKRLIFVVHATISQVHKQPQTTVTTVIARGKKGGGSKKRAKKTLTDESEGIDGSGEACTALEAFEGARKEKLLSALSQALELEFSVVWGHSLPEEQFLHRFAEIGYVMLEHAGHAKSKQTRDGVWGLLGGLLRRYGTVLRAGGAFSSKLVHLLSHAEHAAVPLAEFVERLSQVCHGSGCDTTQDDVVVDLLRELARIDPLEMANDSAGVRNLSAFLSELGDRVPAALAAHWDMLLPLLDGPSYSLRNAVIHIAGRLLIEEKARVRHLGEHDEDGDGREFRDELVEVLSERVRDTAAFCRSKALQTWGLVAEQRALPVRLYPAVAELAVGRLEDKAAHTRKNAFLLLTALLQYNPYGAVLAMPDFAAKLDALRTGNEQASDKLHQFYEGAVGFVTQLRVSLLQAEQLLGSRTQTDVQEAVQYVVTAHAFGLDGADRALRRMLLLMWSKEKAVRDGVVDALCRVFLDVDIAVSARRLVGFVTHTSPDEQASLEAWVGEAVVRGLLPRDLLTTLWDLVAAAPAARPLLLPPPPAAEDAVVAYARRARTGAMMVLAMAAAAAPAVVEGRLDLLLQHPLAAWRRNLDLARHACVAVMKMARAPNFSRLPNDHPLFRRLADMATVAGHRLPRSQRPCWYALAEQAINAIYTLAAAPDALCAAILQRLTAAALQQDERSAPSEPKENDEEEAEEEEDKETASPAFTLSQLAFVVGHVALRQLVHLEDIQAELRRREAARAASKTKSKATTRSKPSSKPHAAKDDEDEEAIERELAAVSGASSAEDTHSERVHQVAEHELLGGSGLLAVLAPVVVAVCTRALESAATPAGHDDNDNDNDDEEGWAESAAVLSLCKLLVVSSGFSQRHLRLLFTGLQRSRTPEQRANIVVALGDLTARFPNLLEPWTPHLYDRLADPSPHVRKTTVLVLTHLILNDMVKVKGHISGIARCIEDPDPRTASLATLFFHELATKGNALFNVLPEVMCHLTAGDAPDHRAFQRIMRFLLAFVDKERQAEALVEKICHRLAVATDVLQARSLSYCLALVNLNDKALRKLSDAVKSFQDKLADDEVRDNLLAVLAKAAKLAKPESKSVLDELAAKLGAGKHTEEGSGEGTTEPDRVGEDSATAKPKPQRGKRTRTAKPSTTNKPTRKTSKRNVQKRKTKEEDEDEEESDAEEEVPVESEGDEFSFDEDEDGKENHPKPSGKRRGKTAAQKHQENDSTQGKASSTRSKPKQRRR